MSLQLPVIMNAVNAVNAVNPVNPVNPVLVAVLVAVIFLEPDVCRPNSICTVLLAFLICPLSISVTLQMRHSIEILLCSFNYTIPHLFGTLSGLVYCALINSEDGSWPLN